MNEKQELILTYFFVTNPLSVFDKIEACVTDPIMISFLRSINIKAMFSSGSTFKYIPNNYRPQIYDTLSSILFEYTNSETGIIIDIYHHNNPSVIENFFQDRRLDNISYPCGHSMGISGKLSSKDHLIEIMPKLEYIPVRMRIPKYPLKIIEPIVTNDNAGFETPYLPFLGNYKLLVILAVETCFIKLIFDSMFQEDIIKVLDQYKIIKSSISL